MSYVSAMPGSLTARIALALTLTLTLAWSHAALAHAERAARDHGAGARPSGVLIQRGSGLALLGVTDDDYAIYQDGTRVYATALWPGARRRFIAEVGEQLVFVQIAGNVAFIWTDRPLDNLAGVSPLIVWTACHGPKFASDASVVATFGAAASPDGRQIVFLTHADRDTLIADIVVANADLTQQHTLASQISADYTSSPCSPFMGFAGQGSSFPVATFCDPGSDVAHFRAWPVAAPAIAVDHISPLARWSADAAGDHFVTRLAESNLLIAIDRHGEFQVLDETPAFASFVNGDSVIAAVAADPTQAGELHRIELGTATTATTVTKLTPINGVYYSNLTNGSGYYADRPTSRDGSLLLYYDMVDPQLGTTDLQLLDLSRETSEAVTVLNEPIATTFGELFTADSSHALYYVFDAGSGGVALHASSRSGDDREVSDGFSAWNNFAATASTVTYLDHAQIDPTDTSPNAFPGFGTVLADLHAVDVARAELQPVLLAAQVYAGYFPAYHRRAVAFSWDRESELSGLYVAWVP